MKRLLISLAVVLVLAAVLVPTVPALATANGASRLVSEVGIIGLLVLGSGLVLVSGGIDVSVGSVAGLAAVSLAVLIGKGVPAPGAVAAVVAGAATLGLLHGLLGVWLRLPSFLVTFAGLCVYRGAAQWVGVEQEIRLRQDLTALRTYLIDSPWGVPMPALVFAALTALAAVLLHGSPTGRYLYAVGRDAEAARYVGVSPGFNRGLALVLSSALAGWVGVTIFLSGRGRYIPAEVDPGQWLEAFALAGAVLGGCDPRGGEGTVPGMVLGAVAVTLLFHLSGSLGGPGDAGLAQAGVAILLGVFLHGTRPRRPEGAR